MPPDLWDKDSPIDIAQRHSRYVEASDKIYAQDAEIERLTEEVNGQARLNGIGAEREADLLANVERLERELKGSDAALQESRKNDMFAMSEVARLNALVAMQAEALNSVNAYLKPRVANSGTTGRTVILPMVQNAISATYEAVSAWQSKRDTEIRAKLWVEAIAEIRESISHSDVDEHRFEDGKESVANWLELRAKGE